MEGFVVNYLREFLAECDEAEANLQFKAEADGQSLRTVFRNVMASEI